MPTLDAHAASLPKRADAEAAFARALAISPFHVPATAALRGEVPSVATGMNAAIGRAIVLARGNRHREAACVFRDALAQALRGHAGWILPVEGPSPRFASRRRRFALGRDRSTPGPLGRDLRTVVFFVVAFRDS